jgi:hypothetical protein
MSVWFVIPAWRRVELSAVCFEQFAGVIGTLRAAGVEAEAVVIADDENLDVARALGFATLERDNSGLGRKFNDGQEYAGNHGADWIVPIGSDSFVDPAYFLPLPPVEVTRTSGMYAMVTARRMAELKVGWIGAGPRMYHRSRLEPTGFRPAPDKLMRTIDSHTVRAIVKSTGPLTWEWRDLHPLQYIGFRYPPYITGYGSLVRTWGVRERVNPWDRLAAVYPPDLVKRVRTLMEAL